MSNLKKLINLEDGTILYGKLIVDIDQEDYEHNEVYWLYVYLGWDGNHYYNYNGDEYVVRIEKNDRLSLPYIDMLVEATKRVKRPSKYTEIKDNRRARRNNYANVLACKLPF